MPSDVLPCTTDGKTSLPFIGLLERSCDFQIGSHRGWTVHTFRVPHAQDPWRLLWCKGKDQCEMKSYPALMALISKASRLEGLTLAFIVTTLGAFTLFRSRLRLRVVDGLTAEHLLTSHHRGNDAASFSQLRDNNAGQMDERGHQ